jgi:hypothetical protein
MCWACEAMFWRSRGVVPKHEPTRLAAQKAEESTDAPAVDVETPAGTTSERLRHPLLKRE